MYCLEKETKEREKERENQTIFLIMTLLSCMLQAIHQQSSPFPSRVPKKKKNALAAGFEPAPRFRDWISSPAP